MFFFFRSIIKTTNVFFQGAISPIFSLMEIKIIHPERSFTQYCWPRLRLLCSPFQPSCFLFFTFFLLRFLPPQLLFYYSKLPLFRRILHFSLKIFLKIIQNLGMRLIFRETISFKLSFRQPYLTITLLYSLIWWNDFRNPRR